MNRQFFNKKTGLYHLLVKSDDTKNGLAIVDTNAEPFPGVRIVNEKTLNQEPETMPEPEKPKKQEPEKKEDAETNSDSYFGLF